MQTQDVAFYLEELDQALSEQGVQSTISVVLLGGAYMLTQINARRMTEDIDIFALLGGEIDKATGLPLAGALYQAAQMVAQKHQLHQQWLNTIRAGALQPPGPPAQQTLWRKYQRLEIYVPEPAYVLVQKLCINRRKDRQDILALFQLLGITTRMQAQAVVDRFLAPQEQQQRNMAMILHSYFP